jgi:hypothetical protein
MGDYMIRHLSPALAASLFLSGPAGAQVYPYSPTVIPVTQGGTGKITLPVHGVLLGEAAANIGNVTAMAADTLLQGQGATADPAAVSLVNCGSATQALAYSTTTHLFTCQSITTGSSALTATDVGYGNVSNVLTGTSDFQWVDGTRTLTLGGTAGATTIAGGAQNGSSSGGLTLAAGANTFFASPGALTLQGANGTGAAIGGGNVNIVAGTSGSSTAGSVTIQVAGATAYTFNPSGSFGLGSTPTFGTSGNVLTSAGSAAAPTWSAPTAALTATDVGYGSAGNLVTGTGDFQWVDSTRTLTLGGTLGATTIQSGPQNGGSSGGLSIIAGANTFFGVAGPLNLQGSNGTGGSIGGGNVNIIGGTSAASTAGSVTIQVSGAVAYTVNPSGALGIGTGPTFGTAGSILTTAGSGAAPSWVAPNVTPSALRAVNVGTAADTVAANIATTYESANTGAGAFTVTFAAPAVDGEHRRVCFKNATGAITWAVTSPATATSGLPTTLLAGQCTEAVYNSASGTPANAPATTWLVY